MLSVPLVPVIKNRAGKVGSLDNYIPVALASILSKARERILLDRWNEFIHSSENQFGFKVKHGTDLCKYAFQEIVNKYRLEVVAELMCFTSSYFYFGFLPQHV